MYTYMLVGNNYVSTVTLCFDHSQTSASVSLALYSLQILVYRSQLFGNKRKIGGGEDLRMNKYREMYTR